MGFLTVPAAIASQNIVPATDPNFADVSLLLHMDGPNASTTFTDNSPNAFTVTRVGNAQISTAQSVFGGASGLFDGTGDWLTVPANAAFNFNANFTVETFVRFGSIEGDQTIISNYQNSSAGWSIELTNTTTSNGRRITVSLTGDVADITSSASLVASQWYHVALTRSGSTVRLFIDGVAQGTFTESANLSGTTLYIGALNIPSLNQRFNNLNAHLDELRITKGVARYTANFTAPTAPFPNA